MKLFKLILAVTKIFLCLRFRIAPISALKLFLKNQFLEEQLSKLSEMSEQRLQVPYENRSKSFYRTDQEFQRQYFHIYESRLRQLGEPIKELIIKKYGKKMLIIYLFNLI